jgi:threonine dehydrogenase-like Zn-dependent dehydrogenase
MKALSAISFAIVSSLLTACGSRPTASSSTQHMLVAQSATRPATEAFPGKFTGAATVTPIFGATEQLSTRPGGSVSYVGVPHGVQLEGQKLFFAHVRLHGGPAPVRRFLPELVRLVWTQKINPGKVFDLTLPLDQVAEGYRAMDQRRAIKALLRP